MSLFSDLRSVGENHFEENTRLKGIAFGLALALGVKYANMAPADNTNVDQLYLANAYQGVNDSLSSIAENVLFDVRYALTLTKQVYRLIVSLKNSPISFDASGSNLLGSLFDLGGYITDEEHAFFAANKEGIAAVYERMAQELNQGE